MRQRRQVAGSSQRTFLWNKGSYSFIQHIYHGLHRLQTDSGKAFHQVIDPQKHDPSGNIFSKGISCAYRMGNDQIFLEGAYAGNTINIYGSDPGACAAQNGGTHTTLEDIAIMRAIPTVEVYDPADGVQLRWLIRELAGKKGVHYIRAARKGMPDIYADGSDFQIGKGNLIREGRMC